MKQSNRNRSLTAMIAFGAIVQLMMVIAGHYNEFVKNNVFAIGGMGISLVFGALWAVGTASSKGRAFAGGAMVGGLCAIIGIAVSVALSDVPATVLAFGTAGSAVSGALGGIASYAIAGRNRPSAA